MRQLGLDGRSRLSPRFVAIAGGLVACVGLIAVATHHDPRPTTLRAAAGNDELVHRFAAPTSTAPFAGSANLTDPATTTTIDGTTATTASDGSVPSTSAPPDTTDGPATTVVPSPTTTATTAPPAPPCGAPPTSSATPPPGKALYWIENTSSIGTADITANSDGPRVSSPCTTTGPFVVTPQHDEPPTAGEDDVGLETGGCGYGNEGIFFHVGRSYVVVVTEFARTAMSCFAPGTPPVILHFHIYDRATGEQMDP